MLRFFYVNTTMVCACCVLPIVCMEARSFASFTNITYIVHIYICVVEMEAKHFASCCPLSVWKREVSLLLLTQRILYIYMCCGNGSETFRFLLPIGCVEARSFASFTNTTLYSMCCGNGSETFRFLLPIGCMEAKCFASCYPLVTTSEMFRFLGHNIRTHESLQKSQYIRRNLFAYYA
jgi:hypothetical protein